MRITESKTKPKMSANERIFAVIIIALLAALVFSATGSWLLAGGMAGVAAFLVWTARLFERMTPADKFHFFQLWKIPDPTTRGTLWLISAYDGALFAALFAIGYVAVFALMDAAPFSRSLDISVSFAARVAVWIMAAGTVSRYWRYRRRYEPIAETGGLLLRRTDESSLTFREKWGLALAVGGVAIAGYVGALVYLLWFT